MLKEQMTIRLYPETRRQMDGWLEESNSKNRNEFVEKALRFYMGYLGTENITEYLSDALVATLRGIVADSANRTNSLLFKCAVEQGIMAHTIAAHFRDTMEDRRALFLSRRNSSSTSSVCSAASRRQGSCRSMRTMQTHPTERLPLLSSNRSTRTSLSRWIAVKTILTMSQTVPV